MNIQLIYIEFSVLLLNRFVHSAYVRKICIMPVYLKKRCYFDGATLVPRCMLHLSKILSPVVGWWLTVTLYGAWRCTQ